MKLLVQRVAQAKVRVEGRLIGEIGPGLLLFLGIHRRDSSAEVAWFVDRAIHLRIFRDQLDKMNFSVQDIGGEVLLISQFTLYAECRTGRRPSFTEAMPSEGAEFLYAMFLSELERHLGEQRVMSGKFGSNMQVELVNDGPVTLLLAK